MSRLVFHLNGVSDEEAQAVRSLLESSSISFYETSAGRWGVSVAAIWLQNDDDYAAARLLINEYQQKRMAEPDFKMVVPSFREKLAENPVGILLAILGLGLVVGLSIYPFISF